MSLGLQKLYQGANQLSLDGPATDRLDRIPEGLDLDKFERGKQFFKKNVFGCIRGMLWSLVIGLSLDRFVDDLVTTGETSKPVDAFRRYFLTLIHVLKWHYGDIWDRHSSARKSIMYVRYRHFKAREFLKKKDSEKENNSPLELGDSLNRCQDTQNTLRSSDIRYLRKSEKDPVHISQFDMSLVQTGFIGLIIMYPRWCGIKCTESELDDFVYVWRWIGYLLGINDSNNICVGGYSRAYSICKNVQFELILPSLANPPDQFEPMANAFLDGIKLATKGLVVFKVKVFVALSFLASDCTVPFDMSITDRLLLLADNVVTKAMVYIPGFTRLLNYVFEKAFCCQKMT